MTSAEFEVQIAQIFKAACESNLDRLDVYERSLHVFRAVFGQELERWGAGGQDSELRDGFMKCLLAAKANGLPSDLVWWEFSKVFEKYPQFGSTEALIEEEDSEGLEESNWDEESEVTPEEEELLQRFLEIMKQEGRASTSLFQRRLRIGYARAARIVDIMELRGIIGPVNDTSDRTILISLDEIS